jgi:hypothetical protein
MMTGEAIGGLVLVVAGITFALWAFYRAGRTDGYDRHRQDMAENRAARRREQHADAYTGRHQLEPWPDGEPFEKLATTGELRLYAETGDIGSLERENAAFWRIQGLRDHVRVKTS